MIHLMILGVLLISIGKIIITLGSYFRSNDHFEFLSQIAGPITNNILDIALIISCFVVDFVMIAGAGSNLNQQFYNYPISFIRYTLQVIFACYTELEKRVGLMNENGNGSTI